jgi:hypothetical protein
MGRRDYEQTEKQINNNRNIYQIDVVDMKEMYTWVTCQFLQR